MNNRSLVVSPSPAESHASSETSETPSISDEQSTNSSAFRSVCINYTLEFNIYLKNTLFVFRPIRPQAKNSRPMVDSGEKEKPPWRPVSIATPSKANRSALLKAKILDATR